MSIGDGDVNSKCVTFCFPKTVHGPSDRTVSSGSLNGFMIFPGSAKVIEMDFSFFAITGRSNDAALRLALALSVAMKLVLSAPLMLVIYGCWNPYFSNQLWLHIF